MFRNLLFNLLFIAVTFCPNCICWENEDYELFDLVEEVNENFYSLLNLSQEATTSEIRKAYYKLSLKLHPDHNKNPDAETKFRQLVGIYDVLKDDGKRQKYNQVLEVGLPNWKNPLYYYRKVRKLGLLEIIIILTTIFTVGHYIILWAAYFEKRYEIEEVLASKLKRREKKLKKGKQVDNTCELMAEQINILSKPSFQKLLPFLLLLGLRTLILKIPLVFEWFKANFLKKRVDDYSNEDEFEVSGENTDFIRKPKRKRIIELPEYDSNLYENYSEEKCEWNSGASHLEIQNSNEENRVKSWSDKDIAALTKMMNRYPSGTSERWEKIALDLQRSVKDVTNMVKSLRNNCERKSVSAELQGLTINTLSECKESELTLRDVILDKNEISQSESKTKCTNDNFLTKPISVDSWSQVQQKALELAIAKYPRGTEERWDKISQCITDKSKDECVQRYKYLVEMVKLKRQK